MPESVNTGGIVKFHYNKDYNPRFTKEQKQEIKDAYQASYERKAREKRNKIILYSIIALIIIAIILYLILK